MSENWSQLAAAVTDALGLAVPPIAITFVDRASDAKSPARAHPVPSSCVFWTEAVTATVTTVAEDHNCSVGRYVHGFVPLESIVGNADVGALLESGWVTPADFGGVAAVDERPAAIVYQPLEQAADPHVVLLRLNPRQTMDVLDAAGDVELSGKPQCQVVAKAGKGRTALTMGCALSRQRTGMGDDEAVCAVPAAELAGLVSRLETVTRANAAVRSYAAAHDTPSA
ncbi:DUF169 domain-containing protein [Rhizohabitans arisaemae]|uniref:DUF169 domain-containing protein n=1 Tax=Rhizohabitans arisaemae TaxID=2720610 RepID=UPI0024B23CB9|nr:DUF169 domain-containing protein [Rhizohabitans arisaemae]